MTLVITRGATYEYTDLDTGAQYFSISQGLKCMEPALYAGAAPDILDDASARGRRVHWFYVFTAAALAGLCPAPPLPHDDSVGYCQAVLKFFNEHKIRPLRLEESSIWPGKRVAGTPDSLVLLGEKEIPTLVELKTCTTMYRTHRVQVQIQRRLEGYQIAKQLRLLYVRADGTYTFAPVDPSPRDEAGFLNAINLLMWRAGG